MNSIRKETEEIISSRIKWSAKTVPLFNAIYLLNTVKKLEKKIELMKEAAFDRDICGDCIEAVGDGYTVCGDCAEPEEL